MQHTVRVWDLPTRLFHWAIVATTIALVATAKVGGNAMQWHMRLGLLMLALLAFRLVWGLVGGHWSRFASFLYSPGHLWRYLAGRGDEARDDVATRPWARCPCSRCWRCCWRRCAAGC